MARPERQLDPGKDLVQAFAAELRALRDSVGRPKYATLAQRSGRSQTALSEAAGGRRLPTWETVAAFVAACNADPADWRRRWQETADALQDEQSPATGAPTPPDADGSTPERAAPDDTSLDRPASDSPASDSPAFDSLVPDASAVGRPVPHDPALDVAAARARPDTRGAPAHRPEGRFLLRRPVLLAAATGAALMLLVLLVVVPALRSTRDAPAASSNAMTVAVSHPPIADESDPKDAGCSDDSGLTTVDGVEIDHERRAVGVLELRYSPRCGVSWPRFVPYTANFIPFDTAIQVDVMRPRDGRRASFEARYAGTGIFGNLLRSTAHCVRAEVRIALPSAPDAVLTGRTDCFRGRVRDPSGSQPAAP